MSVCPVTYMILDFMSD